MSNTSTHLTTLGMQRMLLVASILVFLVGIPLYLVPTRTDTLFSWTINPPLTAAFLGAGYWGSFFIEFLCSRERVWARARVAVPAVLVFTTLTLIATLLHIDKFHFGSDFSLWTQAGTWVWLAIYAFVPPILLILWILQARTQGEDPPIQMPMPNWVRAVFIVQAIIMIPLGIAFTLIPTTVTPVIWPWTLSALTGRAIGAWLIGIGIAAGHMAAEAGWERIYGGLVGYLVFAALELLALARFAFATYPESGEPVVDWTDMRAWVYLLFLASMLLVSLYGWTKARNRR